VTKKKLGARRIHLRVRTPVHAGRGTLSDWCNGCLDCGALFIRQSCPCLCATDAGGVSKAELAKVHMTLAQQQTETMHQMLQHISEMEMRIQSLGIVLIPCPHQHCTTVRASGPTLLCAQRITSGWRMSVP
jgi:hypothetical protein